jgi:outer membrane protein OmpA-like peptidoglycan-associated protein
METRFAHFYTGIFHAQFEAETLGDKKGWNLFNVRLEQRFLLKVEREITLEDFEAARNARTTEATQKWQSSWHSGYAHQPIPLEPHVLLTDNHLIELELTDGTSTRALCSELYVEFGEYAVPDTLRDQDFTAHKDGLIHGRITGRGFVRIPVLSKEEKEIKLHEIEVKALNKRRGCMSLFIPAGFGASLAGGSLLSGAHRRGCGRNGCGFLILPLLLIALFSLWKGCQQGSTGEQRVIHDTVYVDEKSKQNVIKQFLDTTTLFKTEAVELPNVQFYTNSAKLLPYSINSIQQLAAYLIAHPNVHAVIEGHTDNSGDAATNLALSQERAETVRAVLLSFGIEPERIEAKGYGKNHPRADNSTIEGRALNRRVDVRLTNTEHSETKSTEVNKND